jgi:hypothetical protein
MFTQIKPAPFPKSIPQNVFTPSAVLKFYSNTKSIILSNNKEYKVRHKIENQENNFEESKE